MTTLSPIDVRFACTCSHASGAHPPFPVMRCTECDCAGYRPARCVCHLRRNDGTKLPCYFNHGGKNGHISPNAVRADASSSRHQSGEVSRGIRPLYRNTTDKLLTESTDPRAVSPVLAESGRPAANDGTLKRGNGGVVGHAGKCEATSEVAGAGFLRPLELPAFEPRLAPELDREQGQAGANVVVESDGDTSWLVRGSALTAEGPAGSNPAHSQPTDADLYAAWYARQLAERPEGHAAHRRIRSLTKLWATCIECHDAKVRKLQASNDVHVQQKANEMAERRGIK